MHQINNDKFGKFLSAMRKEKSMTQKELAAKTGIQVNTISKMCRNDIKQIPVNAIDQICRLFHCQVSDIFQYIESEKD